MKVRIPVLLGLLLSTLLAMSQNPAGNNTEIQFNNNGSFGATPYLKWDGLNLMLDDMGETSAKLYLKSETGDWGRIFSENYGTNLNRLVFQTGDDGDGDYFVFRNSHWSSGGLDVFEVRRSFLLARGSRAWSETTQGLTKGSFHFDPENNSDHYGSAITFGASDSGNGETAQAGIYTRSDGSYGTKMYFATTDSYATGSKTRMLLDHKGNIGIGTTTPSNLLEVKSSLASTNPALESENDQGTSSYFYTGRSGNSGLVNKTIIENASGNDILLNPSGGNVGIGTISPVSKLTVNGNIQISNASIPMGLMTEVGGTTPLLNMGINFRSPDKNETYAGAGFRVDSRTQHALFQWLYREANSSSESVLMAMTKEGKLGIGTTSPSEKLEVNGTIRTKEVKVESTGWPDYVFSDTYQLNPLSEVSTYIQENHHLPGIPTAQEVAENGIKLGEMNAKLLEKVEELTLYLIEMKGNYDSEIDRLKNENNEFKTRLEKLEKVSEP